MFTLALCLSIMMVNAQDWPQFLGPHRNSYSDDKGLLRSWPANGPEVLWSIEVGEGYGGPAIKDGKVYLLDRENNESDIMRCFDLSSGKELWKYSYSAPGEVPYPGSRSVPTIDGNYLYSCGHNGDLYCIDINTHQPVWHKNIWTDFGGGKLPMWAIAQCPLIYGDMVILTSQAPECGVVAYNKMTGAVVWKTPKFPEETYASPSVAKIDGQDQIIIIISSTNMYTNRNGAPKVMGRIMGMEPKTGKVLWTYNDWECMISVPSATDVGNNKILAVGGYERGATMLQISKNSDGTYKATELFTTEEFGDQTKPALLIDNYFYAIYRTVNRRDGMCCMDMNGNVMWKTKRSPDFEKGSMIYADGLILATDGMKSLYLIEPSPEGFKALAKADILGESAGSQNWAPIALSNGKLLVRNQNQMFCVKVSK